MTLFNFTIYSKTILVKQQLALVLKRGTGSKIASKATECVGKECIEPFVGAVQKSSTTPTSQANNTASDLHNNPPNSPLSAVEITQSSVSDVPTNTSTTSSPLTPLLDDLKNKGFNINNDSTNPDLFNDSFKKNMLDNIKDSLKSKLTEPYSKASTSPTSTQTESVRTFTPSSSISDRSNLGPLGMSSPTIKTTLNPEHSNSVPNTQVRGYAAYTSNDWDPNVLDPQANVNNPPIGSKGMHHPEIHRKICDFPGCSGNICIGLCGNLTTTKAVGHLTHGYPNVRPSQGQVVNLDANSDAKGAPEPQNAVMYRNAHHTGSTLEDVQGTAFVSQPHVSNQIDNYADKT